MKIVYGDGVYTEGAKRFEGKIILSEHKVYLKTDKEELAPTFIPLEKIEKIKKSGSSVEFYVRPAIMSRYVAVIQGSNKCIGELVSDLVARRGLKKKFLQNIWFDTNE